MRRVFAVAASLGGWFFAYLLGAVQSGSDTLGLGALVAGLLAYIFAAELSRIMFTRAFGAPHVPLQLAVAYLGGCLYRAAFLAFDTTAFATRGIPTRQLLLVAGLSVTNVASFAWFLGANVVLQGVIILLINLWAARLRQRTIASTVPLP